MHPIALQGQGLNYYPNGQKQFFANYKNNSPTGETYRYYPNGEKYKIIDYILSSETDFRKPDYGRKDSLIKFIYDSTGNALVDNGKGHFNTT